MCLIKLHKYPKIAKKDIFCIKVLKKSDYALITPYTKHEIRSNIQKEKLNSIDLISTIKCCYISENWIHSHTFYASLHRYFNNGFYIFLCIIPKGTLYYIGKDDDYCSKELIYLKKLSKQEFYFKLDDEYLKNMEIDKKLKPITKITYDYRRKRF